MREQAKEQKQNKDQERQRAELPELSLEEWLWQGAHLFNRQLEKFDCGFSDEFKQHALAARREFLLACRAWIDHALERQERADRREHRQRGRIEVE